MALKALEFYSGIGAFAQAAGEFDLQIVQAFDQSQWANLTYNANYGQMPVSRNLDTIEANLIPETDLWWLSPPCTPFSRRGLQKDAADNRARSFLHLIEMMGKRLPRYLLLENVQGFINSQVHGLFNDKLEACGYSVRQYNLCASSFGVPMLRPRVFFVAVREDSYFQKAEEAAELSPINFVRRPLTDFLFESGNQFDCDVETLIRYEPVLNIVDPLVKDSYLICFTSGYRRCRTASGSLIATGDGQARFLSPAEILGLLGFSANFQFPEAISPEVAYRLVGNSVDVRAIKYLLREVLKLS